MKPIIDTPLRKNYHKKRKDKKRHETVFPKDKQKAFALGEQMARNPWQWGGNL